MIDLSPTQRSEKQSNSVQNLAIFVFLFFFFFAASKKVVATTETLNLSLSSIIGDLTLVARCKLSVCPSLSANFGAGVK